MGRAMKPTPRWVRQQKRKSVDGTLSSVRLAPDDVLIFQTEVEITQRDAEMVKAKFAEYVANPVMVIGLGAKLFVARSAR